MSLAFYWLSRSDRPVGLFLGLYIVLYGAFRVWMDTLHIQPMRFYEGTALILMGLSAWAVMVHFARDRDLVGVYC